MVDNVLDIIQYESGELKQRATIRLFARLTKSGQVWHLQGHYGRKAKSLIDAGIIDYHGNINWDTYEEGIQ